MNDRTEGKIGNLKDISEMKTQAEETWIEWEYLKKTENRKKIKKKEKQKMEGTGFLIQWRKEKGFKKKKKTGILKTGKDSLMYDSESRRRNQRRE